MCFELNCGYYFRILYKKDVYLSPKFMSANEILAKLREFIIICQKTFTTLKIFRTRPMIKALSLGALLLIIKFGLIADISRPNKTGS